MNSHPNPAKLVGTRQALEIVFDNQVRPSADFLRRAARSGRVRSLRVGRKLVFDVELLRSDLQKNFYNSNNSITA